MEKSNILFLNDSKACTQCSEIKNITEFYVKRNGVMSECKKCNNARSRKNRIENKDRYYPQRRAYEIANYEKRKNRDLVRMYGVSLDTYNEMLHAQKGCCKICEVHHTNLKGRKQHLSVDHCHTTGKVRGLLCDTCNRAIGMLQDSVDLLQKAANYLKGKE